MDVQQATTQFQQFATLALRLQIHPHGTRHHFQQFPQCRRVIERIECIPELGAMREKSPFIGLKGVIQYPRSFLDVDFFVRFRMNQERKQGLDLGGVGGNLNGQTTNFRNRNAPAQGGEE
jgi:hypothetical protein